MFSLRNRQETNEAEWKNSREKEEHLHMYRFFLCFHALSCTKKSHTTIKKKKYGQQDREQRAVIGRTLFACNNRQHRSIEVYLTYPLFGTCLSKNPDYLYCMYSTPSKGWLKRKAEFFQCKFQRQAGRQLPRQRTRRDTLWLETISIKCSFLSDFPLPEEALLSIAFRVVAGYVYVSLVRADSSSTVPGNEAHGYTQYLFLFWLLWLPPHTVDRSYRLLFREKEIQKQCNCILRITIPSHRTTTGIPL